MNKRHALLARRQHLVDLVDLFDCYEGTIHGPQPERQAIGTTHDEYRHGNAMLPGKGSPIVGDWCDVVDVGAEGVKGHFEGRRRDLKRLGCPDT